MGVLTNLEPQDVFRYFEEICSIPHPSYKEKKISDYCVQFAKDRNLPVLQDELGNVIITKEASPGYEDRETIILQGHLDMVAEKENDCKIDFDKDGLDLYVDGDYIKARGTTLGGDDGIAVAMGLAILDSKTIKHPRMEVVFTVSEEVGMEGAAGIDLSSLKGHRMMNLDSEEEGTFLVSCAGGAAATITIPVKRTEEDGICMKLSVTGLLGGHSGDEIDKQRANADKVLGRVLYMLDKKVPIGLISLAGGLKDNAITREANAYVMIPKEQVKEAIAFCEEQEKIIKNEYQIADPNIKILLKESTDTENVELREQFGRDNLCFDRDTKQKVLGLLVLAPNGVQRMCMDMPGLVETSLNLGIMKTTADSVQTVFSVRSSIKSCKEELLERLQVLADQYGAAFTVRGDYPAWEYKGKTPFLQQIVDTYTKRNGKAPVVRSIHAGLECGLLSQKIKDLDAVSMGPEILDIHTPQERLSISSTRRVWEFVLDILGQ